MEPEEDELGALISEIPKCCSTIPILRCCCGRTDCAYLKSNTVALDDLEKEVRTAASLGQYMQDAERDRLDMSTKIEKLEADKRALEYENAKSVEENRELLDQLEGLNETADESETHIKSLEATLYSARQELRRLELLASRTHDLEMQLAALEQEQDLLQRTVITSQEEERSAIQRWKKAQRRLADVQEQLEKIEREVREEKEKHVEVMGRMERQRAVERELDTAAGRLKGAAAATTGKKNGSNVVSHFVKDILQDNANLQMGIVELREMLLNSNDEVQTLREQLLMHQPVTDEDGENGSGPPTLRAELAPKEENVPTVISQALHIHHHYHMPKKEEVRRPKKKRASLNTNLFTPPKGIQSPRTPRTQDSASAILSQTSVTIPTPTTPNNRWSMQSGQLSDFAPSSVPSSPQSMFRHSGLFDRLERLDIDSSRPTSPSSSVDPVSPQFQPLHHRKRGSEVSTRSVLPASNFQPHVIHEEDDDVEQLPDYQPTPSLDIDATPSDTSRETEYFSTDTEKERWTASLQSRLRHSTSHESILSVSGIDIHTLRSRPSQITIQGGSALLRPRTRLGTPTTVVSMDTITSSSMVTPRVTMSRQTRDSTTYLQSMSSKSSDSRSISSSNSNEGIKTKLGGWVFGRWGVTPQKSSNDLRSSYLAVPPQERAVSTPVVDPLKAFMGRPSGINQKGPIPGFARKIERAPSKVTPEVVDHDALREILMEGGL
ncbi:uncharacterized protein RCO7_03357 [Rhynchosporium graminicola]|uniref:Uncharacterized protein n=1 Tax=Rhynchosporium graminicola TaxID=2792576 RepID=A0A1E1L797_9HELO|nr:uncharacterized protein RCO7_03357 [Rhynchosporium commune]